MTAWTLLAVGWAFVFLGFLPLPSVLAWVFSSIALVCSCVAFWMLWPRRQES